MALTYEKIATTTLGSAQSSVTFSSISGSYTDIVAILSVKGVSNLDVLIQFNGDTGTNYSFTTLRGNGSTVNSDRYSNYNYGYADLDGYANTTNFSTRIINIMNYSNTTTYKTFLARSATANNGLDAIVNLWRSTSAITSITFSAGANYATDSTFTLYGILKA
jgi:hypothetical protein